MDEEIVSALAGRKMLSDPFEVFDLWYSEARRIGRTEHAGSMCLSTVNTDGLPDGRMVILRAFDRRGFVFYTNLGSVKARALISSGRAALTFYWEELERQVRVQGTVERVSDEEAEAYFRRRPRSSQIAAWASHQSAPLENRSALERRVLDFRAKFKGRSVPRPPFWSGFRVVPLRFEFWRGRASRLHDRYLYVSDGGRGWRTSLLYP